MDQNIVTLREYIDNSNKIKNDTKIKTFCLLMKKVSETIEKEEKKIIKINLDTIKINKETGEIIIPSYLLTSSDLEKTMAGINTGISLLADRKSTKENEKVAFALMVLGWYSNPDKSAVISDMEVLENFSYYMSKVPNWLQDYFVSVFRKMDYDISFASYYDDNFTNKIKEEIKEAFKDYDLTDEQLQRITKLIGNKTNRMIKENAK